MDCELFHAWCQAFLRVPVPHAWRRGPSGASGLRSYCYVLGIFKTVWWPLGWPDLAQAVCDGLRPADRDSWELLADDILAVLVREARTANRTVDGKALWHRLFRLCLLCLVFALLMLLLLWQLLNRSRRGWSTSSSLATTPW